MFYILLATFTLLYSFPWEYRFLKHFLLMKHADYYFFYYLKKTLHFMLVVEIHGLLCFSEFTANE